MVVDVDVDAVVMGGWQQSSGRTHKLRVPEEVPCCC